MQKRYRLTIALAIFSVIIGGYGWAMRGKAVDALEKADISKHEKEIANYTNEAEKKVNEATKLLEPAEFLVGKGYKNQALRLLNDAENTLAMEDTLGINDFAEAKLDSICSTIKKLKNQ